MTERKDGRACEWKLCGSTFFFDDGRCSHGHKQPGPITETVVKRTQPRYRTDQLTNSLAQSFRKEDEERILEPLPIFQHHPRSAVKSDPAWSDALHLARNPGVEIHRDFKTESDAEAYYDRLRRYVRILTGDPADAPKTTDR